MIPAISQIVKQVRQFIFVILKGISGIAVELGYALTIMLAAFFISVLITSF